jgi:hypothetical protein
MTKALTYIEIDVPDFVSGSPEADQTFRFAIPTDFLPASIDAIPSIDSVSFSPARISLGENLGERADLRITLSDHLHIFNGEAYESGTFFSKWRARYGTRLNGRSLRWIQGTVGQTLSEMDTRHFVVENTAGPSFGAKYTIVAKDVLKLADGDRAQAPVLSNGFLVSDITDSATSATLSPSGIGDDEYPASGHVAIGGEEIASFTRSGDVLTITRGQLGTTAAAHETGDRVQLVLRYVGEDPADIIRDLLVTYAGVPSSYIPLSAWQTETDSFLQRLYTATIPEPVSVNRLISELVEQAALAVWWEPLTELIRLQVLRAISTDAVTFDQDSIIENSAQVGEQPNKRLSQIWTYFGQRNSLRPIDEPDNFRSVALTADLEAETEYGRASIKKIFSRWIPFGGRSVALRLNDILLGRYVDPPRKFNFDIHRFHDDVPVLGGGFNLKLWSLQNLDGSQATAPVQVTRLNVTPDRYIAEAEEMLFASDAQVDLLNRVVIIDSNAFNLNLRTIHDTIYPDPVEGESPSVTVTCYIEEGVIVGSTSTGTPAFDIGTWPTDFPVTLVVRGRIQGRGGVGGDIQQNGTDGGPALYTRHAIDLVLNDGSGEIWGGGGGGAGDPNTNNPEFGGGGGAGQLPGAGGQGNNDANDGDPGTTEAGGDAGGPVAGAGGDPGQDGGDFFLTQGGDAGDAIDGVSFVTKTGAGDIRGDEVN